MTVLKPNHITQEYLKEGGIEVLVKDIKRVERYDMPPFKEFYHRILFKVYMTSGECFEILRETVDANGNFSEYSAVFMTKEVRRGEPNRALEIRKKSGLSQAAFSEAYGIPKRTIENWEAAKREAPEYVLNLLERAVKEDFMNKDLIGKTYEDPEGEWEVVAADEKTADVKNIQEDNLNFGKVFTVPAEEARYYINGEE